MSFLIGQEDPSKTDRLSLSDGFLQADKVLSVENHGSSLLCTHDPFSQEGGLGGNTVGVVGGDPVKHRPSKPRSLQK